MSQTRQHPIQLDFKPTLATEEALAAARVVIAELEREQIAWALAGGVAMHLYGFARATQDVDMLAARLPQLKPKQPLSFGGQSYAVQAGEKEVLVDVIVRDDFFRNLYEAALRDAYEGENGWRVLTPEWLAILKFQSGRSKDQIDLLWLLSRPTLVDRELLHAHLTEIMGEAGAEFALRGLQDFYQRADAMRASDQANSLRH
jgi:hypothetical protein